MYFQDTRLQYYVYVYTLLIQYTLRIWIFARKSECMREKQFILKMKKCIFLFLKKELIRTQHESLQFNAKHVYSPYAYL